MGGLAFAIAAAIWAPAAEAATTSFCRGGQHFYMQALETGYYVAPAWWQGPLRANVPTAGFNTRFNCFSDPITGKVSFRHHASHKWVLVSNETLRTADDASSTSNIGDNERFIVHTTTSTTRVQVISFRWGSRYVKADLASGYDPLIIGTTNDGPWEKFLITWI